VLITSPPPLRHWDTPLHFSHSPAFTHSYFQWVFKIDVGKSFGGQVSGSGCKGDESVAWTKLNEVDKFVLNSFWDSVLGCRDWGLGIGDLGLGSAVSCLGVVVWAVGRSKHYIRNPNPHIPNPLYVYHKNPKLVCGSGFGVSGAGWAQGVSGWGWRLGELCWGVGCRVWGVGYEV